MVWWSLLACGPDTLTVKDAAAAAVAETGPTLETAETGSPEETGLQTTAPTGDTGPVEIPCGSGDRPELLELAEHVVTLENGNHVIGRLAGPAELCEISCDVSWLEPFLTRGGCSDEALDLPLTIDYGQQVQLCTLVTTPPVMPSTGYCALATGGQAELAWDILRDD
jgi:hypothetical protein